MAEEVTYLAESAKLACFTTPYLNAINKTCGGIFGGIEGGGTLGGGTPGGGMPILGGGNEPWPMDATLGIFGGIIGGGSETEDESNSLLMSSSNLI